MTDMLTEKIEEIALPEPAEPAAEEIPAEESPAVSFTEADVQARLSAAQAEWDAAKAAEIETLTAEIRTLRRAAARRETEIRCGHLLREHALTEDMASLLLAPEETEVAEEILLLRVNALAGAVEAAAIRALREKTESMRPGVGTDAPLTGKIIRETPVAQLARML